MQMSIWLKRNGNSISYKGNSWWYSIIVLLWSSVFHTGDQGQLPEVAADTCRSKWPPHIVQGLPQDGVLFWAPGWSFAGWGLSCPGHQFFRVPELGAVQYGDLQQEPEDQPTGAHPAVHWGRHVYYGPVRRVTHILLSLFTVWNVHWGWQQHMLTGKMVA